MDPAVNTVASSIPMPDYVLDAVRSINGVKYAVPLYSGGALVKLKSGTYQAVLSSGWMIPHCSAGRSFIAGKIEDIYAENGFIVVNDAEFRKLENPKIGTEFEINDNRGVVVGIGKSQLLRPVRGPNTIHDLQQGNHLHPFNPVHHLLYSG